MIYVVGAVLLVLVIFIVIIIFKYSKLKDIQNSINMCKSNIDDVLKKKLELINALLENIKDDSLNEKFSYNEEASLYEREDCLFNISFEINKKVKQSKKKNKKISDEINKLNELEENIDGLKDFYNTNVVCYNEIFLNKYINKLFKLLGFSGYKSFKIRKLEEYEIFKN